jgi:hypothetical protein
MKNAMMILALSLLTGSACAQKLKETDVPATVKDAFKKMWPDAKVEKWEKEGDWYEAEYEMGKTEGTVALDANGNVMETEKEIKVSELPKAISDYISKNMPGKKIKEASHITDAKGMVTYEAEIDNVDYIFDADGKMLRKEEDKEKDDDKKKK